MTGSLDRDAGPQDVRRRERLAPDLRELMLKKTNLSQEVPRKPLAWPRESRAGGVSRLRFIARASLCAVAILPPMGLGILVQWLILRLRPSAAGALPRLFLWWVGKVLGLRVAVTGHLEHGAPVLVVSNHVSWLDIVALGGFSQLSFVAKSEVSGWPVIGLLARLHRAIFVDRARRSATADIARTIGHRLVGGDTIVLFGEGTTGDGNRVQPFRPALLGSIREAMSAPGNSAAPIKVQPLSIVYRALDGLPLGRAERPSVAWYGDMALGPHLARLLSIGPLDVALRFGEAFEVTHGDRKALASRLGKTVRSMTAETLNGRAHDPRPDASRSAA